MTDSQTAFRTVLINSGAVTALVPAARIHQPWYPDKPTFPLIAFMEIDNYNNDDDYYDNTASSDHWEVECHVFTLPNTTTMTIASAVDTALKADGWNRDFAQSLPDPGNYGHRVMRYSKRTSLTLQ